MELAALQQALGYCLQQQQQGHLQASRQQLGMLAEKFPNHPWVVHYQALSYYLNKEYDAAEPYFWQAIELDSEQASFHFNFARYLQDVGQLDKAKAEYEVAIGLKPDYVKAYENYLALLYDDAEFDKILFYIEQSQQQKSLSLAQLYLLQKVYQEQGNFSEAIRVNNEILKLDPNNPEYLRSRATTLFSQGHVEEGWKYFDYRHQLPVKSRTVQLPTNIPLWRGECLRNKHLFVYSEQGIGDVFIYLSCMQEALEQAQKVSFIVDPRLVTLCQRSFPKLNIIARESQSFQISADEQVDYVCLLSDLVRYFRATAEFPERKQYLIPEDTKRAHWQAYLSNISDKVKVGLYWASSLRTPKRDLYYPSVGSLEVLLTLDNIELINLQSGSAEEFTHGHCVEGLDVFNDIENLAAFCYELDYVIGPSTATALLASAVGTTTLMLAPYQGLWECFGRDDFPLQTSAILCRQQGLGDWDAVFASIVQELKPDRKDA